jgi:hypothetical protein
MTAQRHVIAIICAVFEEDIEFVEFSGPAAHQAVLDHVVRAVAATQPLPPSQDIIANSDN